MTDNKAKAVRTNSLGWSIQRVARRLDVAMSKKLATLDLSIQQFAVMMTVLETDGMTQAEISKKFHMPAYSISRALDHLEKAGLLARRDHPTSRRAHTIHASPKGRALGPKLFAIVQEINDEFAQPLSVDERDSFSKILAKLV